MRTLRTNTVLAERAEWARGLRRLVGLLTRSSLAPGEGMIFPQCRSIHTWFMRFPIDVVFLKTAEEPGTRSSWHGVVVKVVSRLEPFRIAAAGAADTTVELPQGTVAAAGVEAGELLEIMRDNVDNNVSKRVDK